VVDIRFADAGQVSLEHRTPSAPYLLATIDVVGDATVPVARPDA
jgi:hypothetical protein